MLPGLRILLAANDDDQTRLLRGILVASASPNFEVDYAANVADAQRLAVDGDYAAVLLDFHFGGIDGQTSFKRLRAIGVVAPVLLLTSTGWDQGQGDGDDYLPKTEGLTGTTLVRAIVALVQCHELTRALGAARDQAADAAVALTELAHDLATPLGVVLGMTQTLLAEENGLNADARACLEDVAGEALRASEILKRLNPSKLSTSQPTLGTDLRPAVVSGSGSRMVLIADDDPATRRLVRATLRSDRYTVLEAADGQDAWRLVREHHPAVAILDWQMPVYSGLELTDVIKSDPQVQGMTVIMLTGRSTQADRDAGVLARADLYLVKPFLPQQLLMAVEQALGIYVA